MPGLGAVRRLGVARPEARAFWRRWVRVVGAAELAGFAVPALAGVTGYALGLRGAPLAGLALAGGAVEGLVLGYGESRVLAAVLPDLPRRRWMAATAGAAALAWAIGLAPSTLHDLGAPTPVIVAFALPGSVALLLSLGAAQWAVLQRHLEGAHWWIWANAGAWLAGLPATFVFPALVPNDAPPWAFAIAFIAAGGVMATTIAAVLGRALVAMLAHAGVAMAAPTS